MFRWKCQSSTLQHTVVLAWVAIVRTTPRTLAVTNTGNLLALSREQHMTACPEGITVCIVLLSQLQTAMKASPTLALFCSSLTGESAVTIWWLKVISGCQEVDIFNIWLRQQGLALHALLNFSSCERVRVEQWEHDSSQWREEKLISLIGCVCCSMALTAEAKWWLFSVLFCHTVKNQRCSIKVSS